MKYELKHGDCLDVLRSLPTASIDAVVTDPPYGLSFMGKKWDYDVPAVDVWAECLRVLKPGGHLLAFAGTRTQHRMAVRIEDAGFEIRDMIAWVYGSGFPKSLDVGKAIDKRGGYPQLAATIGAEIKAARVSRGLTVGECDKRFCGGTTNWSWFEGRPVGQRAPTPDTFAKIAAEWPELAELAAMVDEAEREVVGKKTAGIAKPGERDRHTIGASGAVVINITAPATDAAKQWQGWGTALKPAMEPITVARKPLDGTVAENVLTHGTGGINVDGCRVGRDADGRWPANLIHDGSAEVTGLLGDAARFFYCAKASKTDRDEGCEGLEAIHRANGNKWTDQDYRVANGERPPSAESGPRRNHHPTVKPTALMRYLCRLVTPPGGVVLDPFMGSGSTGKAAMLEGFRFVGIERDASYFEIAGARIASAFDLTENPTNKQAQLW